MTPDYKEILQALRDGKWSWMKVKRFKPEDYATIESGYVALEAHHVEETTFMLNVIRALGEQLEAKSGS
jgi:hypothetical protein